MSRGPGVSQRKILDALATHEYVFLEAILPRGHTRGQRFACRRAAQRLADRGLVTLESMGGEVCVICLHNSGGVSHIDAMDCLRQFVPSAKCSLVDLRESGGAFMAKAKHNWAKLDPRISNLKAQGWTDTQIAKDLHIGRQTLVDHLRSRESVHLGTPETTEVVEVPQEAPGHPGTLEGYQEVIEEIQQSVPEVAHLVTDEAHPSTPEVHPEVSVEDSSMAHSGVPARHDHLISTPMVHPGTPTADDWELWAVIKARWSEVEKLLADRQALIGTLTGTPGNTRKKTYVFDMRHIALIDRYAQEHHLDLKEVLFRALNEFFQRRGYLDEYRQ